jgi:hypothetical protein
MAHLIAFLLFFYKKSVEAKLKKGRFCSYHNEDR